MTTRRAFRRRACARALFLAASFATTPAAACTGPSVATLAEGLPAAARYDLGDELLPAFLSMWAAHGGNPLPGQAPDHVTVLAMAGKPLLVAFERAGCLIGVLPVPPAELWRALRAAIGPIA